MGKTSACRADASVGLPTSDARSERRDSEIQYIMAYVYILQGLQNKRFYIGSTKNLGQRLKHHFGGFTPSTKKFGQIKLALSQKYPTLKEARMIEKRLKKLKRKDYIEKIVKDGEIKMRT